MREKNQTMNRDMNIDFGEYLEFLGTQKFRGIILHHESCSALSRFAQQVADAYQGKYLDLLEHFTQHDELARRLDVFDIEQFEALLKEQAAGHSLLVVDRMDFLVDTWYTREKNALYELLRHQWNSFFRGMQATIVLCMHSGHDLHEVELLDTRGNNRIHPLSDFRVIV